MLIRLFTLDAPEGFLTRVYELPNHETYPEMTGYQTVGEDIIL